MSNTDHLRSSPPIIPPASIAILTPVSPRHRAHKQFTNCVSAAGERIETVGYGNASQFHHATYDVLDIEALGELLASLQDSNAFAIHGSVRPGAGPVINRRTKGNDADILDIASRIFCADLDGERTPDGLDIFDPVAVGDYLRSRLPAELRDVSCVVQLSNSHGLKPEFLKAHLWFVLDSPIDADTRRRWMKFCNDSAAVDGRATLDPAVAKASQPLYFARPSFENMVDPCPRRIALLLGDVDEAHIEAPVRTTARPIAAPAVAGQPIAAPGMLSSLCAAVRDAVDGQKHAELNRAAFTAGGFAAGGAFSVETARWALREAIGSRSVTDLGAAFEVIDRALADGAALPIYASAPITPEPVPVLPELPTADESTEKLDSALSDFFIAAKTEAPKNLGIAAAAGLGKSTRALAIALESQVTVDYFTPTQRLAMEQAARLLPGQATVIRGRTHSDIDAGLAPLCAKHEAAESLQKAGLGRHHQILLCGKPNADGRFPCPHAAGCGYHEQFTSTAPIRFYSHDWLTLGNKERPGWKAADVGIVDESFAPVFETTHRWTMESLGEIGGVFYVIGEAVRDGRLNSDDHAELIKSALDTAPMPKHPPIHPEMSAVEAIAAIRNWNGQPKEKQLPWDLLRCAQSVLKSGESNRLYAAERNGKTTIYYAGLKELSATAGAWLFLDASLMPDMVQKVKPNTPVITIEARRNVRIIQITDSALSYKRLSDNADYLTGRIAELAERLKLSSPAGAVNGPMEFISRAKADGHFAGLPTGHFGALRGLNSEESADWLIQIGRMEPPSWAVDHRARCWFADDPDLKLGTVQRTAAPLIRHDGTTAAAPLVTSFADPRCQALLQSMREQESIQSIDRLRLVHAVEPKTVMLLSNLPLPGIRPDETVRLDELLFPGRLAMVLTRDHAITGPAMLAKRHPDLFETPKTAEHVLGGFKPPVCLYKVLIGKRGVIGLELVRYRTAGQRGQNRGAWLYSGTPAADVLAAIHGEPVTLRTAPPAESAAPEPAPPVDPILTGPRRLTVLDVYPDRVDPVSALAGANLDLLEAEAERMAIMAADDIEIPSIVADWCDHVLETDFMTNCKVYGLFNESPIAVDVWDAPSRFPDYDALLSAQTPRGKAARELVAQGWHPANAVARVRSDEAVA